MYSIDYGTIFRPFICASQSVVSISPLMCCMCLPHPSHVSTAHICIYICMQPEYSNIIITTFRRLPRRVRVCVTHLAATVYSLRDNQLSSHSLLSAFGRKKVSCKLAHELVAGPHHPTHNSPTPSRAHKQINRVGLHRTRSCIL